MIRFKDLSNEILLFQFNYIHLFYVDVLRPSQQFFSHAGTFSCLPVLN